MIKWIKRFFRKGADEEHKLVLPLVPPIKVNSRLVIDYVFLDKYGLGFHTNVKVSSFEEDALVKDRIKDIFTKNTEMQLIEMIKQKGVPVYD